MRGTTLKTKLVTANIKQVDLANRLGMSKQGLGNILNNENHVSSELLERIAEALGVGMDFFYPIASGQTNANNFGKQHAQNINNGGNDVTQTAGADGSTIAMLVQQNAELIALLKAEKGL